MDPHDDGAPVASTSAPARLSSLGMIRSRLAKPISPSSSASSSSGQGSRSRSPSLQVDLGLPFNFPMPSSPLTSVEDLQSTSEVPRRRGQDEVVTPPPAATSSSAPNLDSRASGWDRDRAKRLCAVSTLSAPDDAVENEAGSSTVPAPSGERVSAAPQLPPISPAGSRLFATTSHAGSALSDDFMSDSSFATADPNPPLTGEVSTGASLDSIHGESIVWQLPPIPVIPLETPPPPLPTASEPMAIDPIPVEALDVSLPDAPTDDPSTTPPVIGFRVRPQPSGPRPLNLTSAPAHDDDSATDRPGIREPRTRASSIDYWRQEIDRLAGPPSGRSSPLLSSRLHHLRLPVPPRLSLPPRLPLPRPPTPPRASTTHVAREPEGHIVGQGPRPRADVAQLRAVVDQVYASATDTVADESASVASLIPDRSDAIVGSETGPPTRSGFRPSSIPVRSREHEQAPSEGSTSERQGQRQRRPPLTRNMTAVTPPEEPVAEWLRQLDQQRPARLRIGSAASLGFADGSSFGQDWSSPSSMASTGVVGHDDGENYRRPPHRLPSRSRRESVAGGAPGSFPGYLYGEAGSEGTGGAGPDASARSRWGAMPEEERPLLPSQIFRQRGSAWSGPARTEARARRPGSFDHEGRMRGPTTRANEAWRSTDVPSSRLAEEAGRYQPSRLPPPVPLLARTTWRSAVEDRSASPVTAVRREPIGADDMDLSDDGQSDPPSENPPRLPRLLSLVERVERAGSRDEPRWDSGRQTGSSSGRTGSNLSRWEASRHRSEGISAMRAELAALRARPVSTSASTSPPTPASETAFAAETGASTGAREPASTAARLARIRERATHIRREMRTVDQSSSTWSGGQSSPHAPPVADDMGPTFSPGHRGSDAGPARLPRPSRLASRHAAFDEVLDDFVPPWRPVTFGDAPGPYDHIVGATTTDAAPLTTSWNMDDPFGPVPSRDDPAETTRTAPMTRRAEPRLGAGRARLNMVLSRLRDARVNFRSGIEPGDYMRDEDFESLGYDGLWRLADRVSSQRRSAGLTVGGIARLERVKVLELAGHEGSSRDSRCGICLEDYDGEDVLIKLSCSHAMHEPCLSQWLKTSGTCPCCRATVD